MDEQLDKMNAILQGMQQALKCNICLDMLKEPLTTKCGHSFCGECVHQLVKRPRASAQCPLCMGGITKRSLSRNAKVTALVLAVRKVIASIKKDCCFEVTPSKYRPRPHLEAAVGDDDSENEEMDEPRRGTRKRGATALYNPEVIPTKPKQRPAKRRILAANGAQELSLHSEGVTADPQMQAKTGQKGEENLLETIARDHSYSSPTKQAPLERLSTAPHPSHRPRGRGRAGAHAYLGPKKLIEKNGDNLVSASQGEVMVLPGEVVGDPGVGVGEASRPLPCLTRERPEDKVAKWLNTSREVGFRIGLTNSTSMTTSTPSTTIQDPLRSSGYPGSSISTSSGHPHSTTSIPSTSTTNKFFKIKYSTSASTLAPSYTLTLTESQDPYTFIPSQKTPPRLAQNRRRGRGRGPGRGRVPGRGRGRGRGLARPSVNVSTPAGHPQPRPALEVSAIHAPRESIIIKAHDDDDDDSVLPDSCPVNTLDDFDQLVAEAKENNPPRPLQPAPLPPLPDEDAAVGLFITPLQDIAAVAPQDIEQGQTVEDTETTRKEHKAQRGKKRVTDEALIAQEILAGVEDHELTVMTPKEVKDKQEQREQEREAVLHEDLSLLNLTHDNTVHNRTLPTTTTTTTAMAPPAPPSGRKRVTFNSETDTKTKNRAKTRYVSGLKQHLMKSERSGPVAVGLKSAKNAKSPGWSHIAGARKDLLPRNVSLNITGGEGRLAVGGRKAAVASSIETCLSIEDTQYDVEHLQLSQTKVVRVQRLKNIVSGMIVTENTRETFEDAHNTTENSENAHDKTENGPKTLENAHEVTENAHGFIGNPHDAVDNTHNITENAHNISESKHSPPESPHNTTGSTHRDSIVIGQKKNKELKLSLQRLIPEVDKMVQKEPYIVKDTERVITNLSPRARQPAQIEPVTRKGGRESLLPLLQKSTQLQTAMERVRERESESSSRSSIIDEENLEIGKEKSEHLQERKEKRDRKKNTSNIALESEKNKTVLQKDYDTGKYSGKTNAEIPITTSTEPFFEDEMHSDDTARPDQQVDTAGVSSQPQQGKQKQKYQAQEKTEVLKQNIAKRKQRGTSQQQEKQATASQQKEEKAEILKQSTAKRKERDTSQQHSGELTQHLTHQADAPPGKRIKQGTTTSTASVTDSPHSTDSDSLKSQRKTFSFTTETEDLNVLLEQPTTASQHDHKPSQQNRNLTLSRHSKYRPPQRGISSVANTAATVTSDKGAVTSELWSSSSRDPPPPLVTSVAQQGRGEVKTGHAVVPFMAVGRLCSKRCIEAGGSASVVPNGALTDLCLHSVPCEVYQVLMKYIGLLTTQAGQHSVCCGKVVHHQHQQKEHPSIASTTTSSSPLPTPTSTTAAVLTTATTATAVVTTPVAVAAAAAVVASQREGVCTTASSGSVGDLRSVAECHTRAESEPLFESEVVHDSCPTQDMVPALPLPLPYPAAGSTQDHTMELCSSATSECQVGGGSQGPEELSEVFGLLPEALLNNVVQTQQATDEVSQESVSLLAEFEDDLPDLRKAEHDGQGTDMAECSGVGTTTTSERTGTGNSVANVIEVEKENVGGQVLGRALSLRRKPQKAHRPVLQNILTQQGDQREVAPTQKTSLPPTAKPLFSPGRSQRGEMAVVQEQPRAKDSEGSEAEEGQARPPRTRLSGRKNFRRIARPPSSSSDSEGDAAPPPTVDSHLTQHLLDSEEMRDLERLDGNVWAEFGRPDEDHTGPAPSAATTTTTTLSASTRHLVDRANHSLAKVEAYLGPPSLSHIPHEPQVVPDTDDEEEEEEEERKTTVEEEEEEETLSHGSTQSEGISTQKQKQMKEEIEALRRKKEEVIAALGNRTATNKHKAGVEAITASQVDSLASTCPFNPEEMSVEDMEDMDLFPSNPGGDDVTSPPLSPRQLSPPPLSPPQSPPQQSQTQPLLSLPQLLQPKERQILQRTPRVDLISQNKKKNGAKRKPCAVFSGLGLQERRRIQESLSTLDKIGLSVKAAWGPEVTHVVVQTKDGVAPRTLKYLQGVASGCWVLNQLWVMDSLTQGKLLLEEPYEVLDESGEDGPSRSRTSHTHLLGGCEVCVVPPFEDITLEQVQELAEMAGARVVESPKKFSCDQKTLTLLLLDAEREEAGKELMEQHKRVAVGHNWLVDSITCHRLVSLPEHLLGIPSSAIIEASGIPPALLIATQTME